MAANLYIKYVGPDPSRTSNIDLKILGESIQGFDQVIRELVKVLKIEGEVEVKATQISDGSILVKVLVELVSTLPFSSPQDYLDFLQFINSALHAEVSSQWSQLMDVHENVNEWATRNPVDFAVVQASLTGALVKLVTMTRKQKNAITAEDDEGMLIPAKYPARLKKLINNRVYRKALKPFVEGEAVKIEVSAREDFQQAAQISDGNFGDYLSEEELVLPEWENGSEVDVTGKILSLQCTRGESLKFKVTGVPRKHQLLIAYPPDGKTTQDYLTFYRKDVWIKAEVVRKSLYQKPNLVIKDIGLVQRSMDGDE